ncbi:MAG: hypothetical protein MMC33_003778 [Icmadophila ericetorum]|nr:hypothetical protein [Icmadophila ericetorum]
MAFSNKEKVALQSIELLERRLRNLQFQIIGRDEISETPNSTKGKEQAVRSRLANMEEALEKLSAQHKPVNGLLQLYEKYPDIFPPTSPTDEYFFTESERLSVVTSSAILYSNTASRLRSLQDMPIPSAESSTTLISLNPRIAEVQQLQDSQAAEITQLRLRTAETLQRWYEIQVLAGGECWNEWEERVGEVEKRVRREETARARAANAA